MRKVYLDYNSTSPLDPQVREAMLPFFDEHFALPSSVSSWGRACEEAVEDARGLTAQLLQAESDEIVFTSGGTESCNLAIFGAAFGRFDSFPLGGHTVVTALEHAAVWESVRMLRKMGVAVSIVPADKNGMIEPEAVERCLRDDTFLVSVTHASHEIGTVQPIREIGTICRTREILFHVDACQTIGRIPTMVEALEADLLSISGQKIHGPKGIGALFVRRGTPLDPLLQGSPHESGVRPGMENVPGMIGMGQAATILAGDGEERSKRMLAVRDRMELNLVRAIGEEIVIHGADVERLPNTSYVSFQGVRAMEMVQRLPELAVATGLGCGVMQDGATIAQRALGLSREQAKSSIRISVGPDTTDDDVDFAADRLIGAFESLRR